MTQTKKQSMYEALVNVAVGYIISLISLSIILPLMGIETTTSKNIQITLYFTVISIIRSYTLRRYFNTNNLTKKAFKQQLAKWGSAAANAIRR